MTKTTNQQINANQIKNILMAYWRFKRGFPYAATECWSEDVVVSDIRTLVYTEIKLSISDFKAEFSKRRYFLSADGFPLSSYRPVPTKKYFSAPDSLATRIAEEIEVKNLPFGVIKINTDIFFHRDGWLDGEYQCLETIRRATTINPQPPTVKTLTELARRMSSELISVRHQKRN